LIRLKASSLIIDFGGNFWGPDIGWLGRGDIHELVRSDQGSKMWGSGFAAQRAFSTLYFAAPYYVLFGMFSDNALQTQSQNLSLNDRLGKQAEVTPFRSEQTSCRINDLLIQLLEIKQNEKMLNQLAWKLVGNSARHGCLVFLHR
jgi:hypothetical protein